MFSRGSSLPLLGDTYGALRLAAGPIFVMGCPDVIEGLASYRSMLDTGFGVIRVPALGSSGGDLDGLVGG